MNPSTRSTPQQLLKIGMVSNILEWFEFSVYACLASTMGKLFLMTETNPITALIQAYALFSASYLARPLGSFFYGFLGDHKGRGHSLRASLLTMAIPTALIGMLPTYYQIGSLATTLLLLLRFAQGFSAGGELGVSACYVFESASSPKFRSFLCSAVSVGGFIGFLSGSAIVTGLFWYLDSQALMSWGWRIPYLLSIPITLWIFRLRKAIHESTLPSPSSRIRNWDQFKAYFQRIQTQFLPLIMIIAFVDVCYYVLILWMPAYFTHFLHLLPSTAQLYSTIATLMLILCSLMVGWLAGKIGYKRIFLTHLFLMLALCIPLFQGLQSASSGVLLTIHLILASLLSGLISVSLEILASAYVKEVRAFGMSLTHTLGASLFGGTAPLICTYLTHKTGLLIFPALYIVFFGLLALPIALRLPSHSYKVNL